MVDVVSDPEVNEGLFLSCGKIATNVVRTGGVPHPERHGSAELQPYNTSIDGEALGKIWPQKMMRFIVVSIIYGATRPMLKTM